MNVGGWVRRIFRRTKPEDQMSVMPAWAIWVGGLAVLVVGVLSGWLLLSRFGSGTAQDRVQLEILRLTGSIALGSGGAVALLLAARRQRATEVDIAQKKQATEDARYDATERRVTELYTKAAEQLGSDKAAVRLAGLYALERLAQDNPDHRPTIVEVICAYLRMPYTPPSADGSSAAHLDGQVRRRRGLRPPNQRHTATSPMRTMTTLASTLSSLVEPGQDQHQELQVRLAAQRVLTTHLRPNADEQGKPRDSRFWPGVKIDLTGATLVDWDMSRCEVNVAVFDEAIFYGHTSFRHTTIKLLASFEEAAFHGLTAFECVTSHGAVELREARFYKTASFDGIEIGSIANFDNVHFCGFTKFRRAKFRGPAWFDGTVFYEYSEFDEVIFCEGARLDSAEFHGSYSFEDVVFVRKES